MAQEEEKRCNGSTSCLKTGAKQRSETHKKRGRGERTERERSLRGEKSFGAGRGSELDEARKDTEGGKHTEKPSQTGEREEVRECMYKVEKKKKKRRRKRGSLTGGRAYGA